MRRWMVMVLLVATSAAEAAAQERSVRDDMGRLWSDFRFIVGAPTHASTRDVRTTAALAGVAGLLLLVDKPIEQWLRSEPFITDVIRPFDEDGPVAIMGRTWFFLLPLSAGL